jgi:hypothetical protein
VEWHWQGRTEVLSSKPAPEPLCPLQDSERIFWERTLDEPVRSRRLTPCAKARLPANLSSRCSTFRYSYIKIICEICVAMGWPQACDLWCAALWHGIQNAIGYPHVPDTTMLRRLLTVEPTLRHIHPTEQEGHKTFSCKTSLEYKDWSRNHVTLAGNMSTEECQKTLRHPVFCATGKNISTRSKAAISYVL